MRTIFDDVMDNFNKAIRIAQEVNNSAFECQICAQKTPKACEGTEPNTCADCMPEQDDRIITHQEIL